MRDSEEMSAPTGWDPSQIVPENGHAEDRSSKIILEKDVCVCVRARVRRWKQLGWAGVEVANAFRISIQIVEFILGKGKTLEHCNPRACKS